MTSLSRGPGGVLCAPVAAVHEVPDRTPNEQPCGRTLARDTQRKPFAGYNVQRGRRAVARRESPTCGLAARFLVPEEDITHGL
jgi:hypothetical protein